MFIEGRGNAGPAHEGDDSRAVFLFDRRGRDECGKQRLPLILVESARERRTRPGAQGMAKTKKPLNRQGFNGFRKFWLRGQDLNL
ncbi:hypothetical protein G4G28_19530 [Massilia sp. Dwa41.01b]|uniref:hypothetical protein n=1 Tax=unclassified Massilia TaxID=2609279 RepID=UPI0016045590|nr:MULTISPECIES: hypothetical protein [unclassified Massilia]QNA90142.1 hypothetical protein G4G28_19530 [Massilia sp. Dwa41.01b]QNB01032.1 hypothetical protein G4G31_23135 [Massilia sp. Se16.2.3]